MNAFRTVIIVLILVAALTIQAGSKLVDQYWQATETIQCARSIVTALAAYHMDNGRYPAVADMAGVKAAVEPMYIRTTPVADGWGTEFLYRVSEDGDSFVLASAGSDRKFDESTWNTSAYSRSSKDDLVYTSDDVKREWVIQDICR